MSEEHEPTEPITPPDAEPAAAGPYEDMKQMYSELSPAKRAEFMGRATTNAQRAALLEAEASLATPPATAPEAEIETPLEMPETEHRESRAKFRALPESHRQRVAERDEQEAMAMYAVAEKDNRAEALKKATEVIAYATKKGERPSRDERADIKTQTLKERPISPTTSQFEQASRTVVRKSGFDQSFREYGRGIWDSLREFGRTGSDKSILKAAGETLFLPIFVAGKGIKKTSDAIRLPRLAARGREEATDHK